MRSLRGPFPEPGLLPTGGIGVEEVGAYLAAGATCVGLGASLVGSSPPTDAGAFEDTPATRGRGGRSRAVNDRFDLIALGETMLSLVAADGSLDEATTFRATHGGAESNVCVGAARLGLRTAWVSRLGDDPAGRTYRARRWGRWRELTWVRTDETRSTGLMLRDTAGAVRYWRAGSAAGALSPDDLDGVPLGSARSVLVTGITPCLGADPQRAAIAFLDAASGLRVVDPNLRPGLWGSARAAELDPAVARAVRPAAGERVGAPDVRPGCGRVAGTRVRVDGSARGGADAGRGGRGRPGRPRRVVGGRAGPGDRGGPGRAPATRSTPPT